MSPDPVESAKAAGLRYVGDDGPGLLRRRAGKGFVYLDADGRTVRDRATLARIRSLAIPPAWTSVWICPRADGHLQATGRDARKRKQYRYHPRWRAVRDETKYDKMIAFARALPKLRARVHRDLKKPGLPREKVLATVVGLLDTTLVRVGNEEYARANHSYGLTTLRTHHAEVSGSTLRFEFRGKSGKRHAVEVGDAQLARVVAHCQSLPGQELFQYIDDEGTRRPIDSADVNEYLRETCGEELTAKDFRTWAGTVLAARALADLGAPPSSRSRVRKIVTEAICAVAHRLGNTPAVCRRCYVHPAILTSYEKGALETTFARPARAIRGLEPDEVIVLAFLEGLPRGNGDLGELLDESVRARAARRRPSNRRARRAAHRARRARPSTRPNRGRAGRRA